MASTNPLSAMMERLREHAEKRKALKERERQEQVAIEKFAETLNKENALLEGDKVEGLFNDEPAKPPKPVATRPRRKGRHSNLH